MPLNGVGHRLYRRALLRVLLLVREASGGVVTTFLSQLPLLELGVIGASGISGIGTKREICRFCSRRGQIECMVDRGWRNTAI